MSDIGKAIGGKKKIRHALGGAFGVDQEDDMALHRKLIYLDSLFGWDDQLDLAESELWLHGQSPNTRVQRSAQGTAAEA